MQKAGRVARVHYHPGQVGQEVHEEGSVEVLAQLVQDEPVAAAAVLDVAADVVHVLVPLEVPEV